MFGQGNELGGGTFTAYTQELKLPQHTSCHRELRPYADLMNWLKIVDNNSFVKLRKVILHLCASTDVVFSCIFYTEIETKELRGPIYKKM